MQHYPCGMIVMGTVANFVRDSVVTKEMHFANIPATLVNHIPPYWPDGYKIG